MRALTAVALALLLATSAAAQQDDDEYGEKLCQKYMPPGTPCECVGEILEEEFDEEELEPLLQFLRAFMTGLKGDDKDRPEDHRCHRGQAWPEDHRGLAEAI